MAPGSPRGTARHHSSQGCPPVLRSTQGLFHMTWGLMGVFARSSPGLGSLPSSFSFHCLSPCPHPQSLRHGLQKTQEQAQHQEQLLKEQEGELKALQEQLSR